MLEKSFGLLFFMRKPKNYKSGQLPIYLKITVNGEPKELSVERKWDPAKWSSEAGRALGNKEEAKALNLYLNLLEQKVHDAKRSLMEANKPITAAAVKTFLWAMASSPKMILELFAYHNEQMKSLEGVEYAPGTVERYQTAYSHTESFIRWKYNAHDKDIRELDGDSAQTDHLIPI
jgi:hypothetical protein